MRRIVRNVNRLSAVWFVAICAGVVKAEPLAFSPVQPGIERAEISARTSPDATPMRIWVYRPAVHVPAATWPCVFVAASGSTGATGVRLQDGDSAEHLPYVKQGFVVVAFDLDGAVDHGATADQYAAAMNAYVKADGGLSNLRAAITAATQAEPSIDPTRIYVAGHGSAGALALRAAATVPDIRGVVAYAPLLDPAGTMGAANVEALDSVAPGLKTLLAECQPASLTQDIRVPVMLFSAADDDRAPIGSLRKFDTALRAAGNPPLTVEVPSGGHVEAMLSRGLDAGAAWLADRAKRDAKTPTTRP